MFNAKQEKFPKHKIIPLIVKLGDYLRNGFDHYVELQVSGVPVDADLIALFIDMQMKDWEPVINGKEILDPETKAACARFLAGIAFNLATKEK